MTKMRMCFIVFLLMGVLLVGCEATTQEVHTIHFQLELNFLEVSDLRDHIIDKLADLALGRGDTELAKSLAIVSRELQDYMTNTGASVDASMALTLDGTNEGGKLVLQYLDQRQQQQGGVHELSLLETQKLYKFLSDWSASKK